MKFFHVSNLPTVSQRKLMVAFTSTIVAALAHRGVSLPHRKNSCTRKQIPPSEMSDIDEWVWM